MCECNDILLQRRMDALSLVCFCFFPISSALTSNQAPKQHYATACMESDLHIVFLHLCSLCKDTTQKAFVCCFSPNVLFQKTKKK